MKRLKSLAKQHQEWENFVNGERSIHNAILKFVENWGEFYGEIPMKRNGALLWEDNEPEAFSDRMYDCMVNLGFDWIASFNRLDSLTQLNIRSRLESMVFTNHKKRRVVHIFWKESSVILASLSQIVLYFNGPSNPNNIIVATKMISIYEALNVLCLSFTRMPLIELLEESGSTFLDCHQLQNNVENERTSA